MQAQGGLTLFRDIYKSVFGRELRQSLPSRVLPLSTTPPTELAAMFANEVAEVRKLLVPGQRRRLEATAKMRALAILDASVLGHRVQPAQFALDKLANDVQTGKSWEEIFPGVASLQLTTNGHGPSLDLRISKKEGIAVEVVPEGASGSAVVALKRVDELGYFNMTSKQLAEHLQLTQPRTVALIRHLQLESDSDAFKLVAIGKSTFKRYSQKSLALLRTAKGSVDMQKVWRDHAPTGKSARKGK